MTNFSSSEAYKEAFVSNELSDSNQLALDRLVRAISLAQEQFSLILANCNSYPLRQQAIRKLKEISPIPLIEINLHPSVNSLFNMIQDAVQGKQPSAMMIMGLESVVELDELFSAANMMRDEFSKNFSFPIVLWINDEISYTLRKVAPDFRNWAAPPIRFFEADYSTAPTSQASQRDINEKVRQEFGLPSFSRRHDRKLKTPVVPGVNQPQMAQSGQSNVYLERLDVDYGLPEVMIIQPNSFNDILPLINGIRTRKTLILNLNHLSPHEAQRIVDFFAGVTYALNGDQERVGESVFVFTPGSVHLKTDFSEEQEIA